MSTLARIKVPVSFAPDVSQPIPITDRSRVNQFPAVDAPVIGSKGLETGGYKPLMQNHSAPLIERRRDRVTAGNILCQRHLS